MYPYPNGPFGNMMPYSDFHGMNLDWVIQIAKNFLDQYTHIQDVIQEGETDLNTIITNGKQELQNKYNTLKGMLDGWYNSHSSDIANQLGAAIASFNAAAQARAAEVIASIPEDYTELSNAVVALGNSLDMSNISCNLMEKLHFVHGTLGPDGTEAPYNNRIKSQFLDVSDFNEFIFSVQSGYKYDVNFFNASQEFISHFGWYTTAQTITKPSNAKYMRLLIADTSDNTASLAYQRSITGRAIYSVGGYDRANSDQIHNISSASNDIDLSESFSIGYIYADGRIASPVDQPNYVCTQAIITLPVSVAVTPDLGYQVTVRLWNINNQPIASTDWMTDTIYIPAGTRFTLNASKTTPAAVTDISEYINAIKIRSYIVDSVLSEAEKKSIKLSILGDSVSSYEGYSEADYEYYPTGNVTDPALTWWGIVANKLGCMDTVDVSAISRTAYYDIQEEGRTPMYDDTRIARLATHGTPTLIIVYAGTNDPFQGQSSSIVYTDSISDLEALANSTMKGVALTIRKLQTAYPSAKIAVVIPHQVRMTGMESQYTLERVCKVADYIATYAAMYGAWKVIDIRKCGINQNNASSYMTDGIIHPNAKGMRSIADYIIDNL